MNLIDFAKTDVLEPGASETLSFSIPAEDMASYDSNGIKVAGGGYILEAGDYDLPRADSHTVLAEETFKVDADVITADGRSTTRSLSRISSRTIPAAISTAVPCRRLRQL